MVRFNKDGNIVAACYQLPEFKIVLLAVGETKMRALNEIPDIKAKVLALDFSRDSNYIRINTLLYDYTVF